MQNNFSLNYFSYTQIKCPTFPCSNWCMQKNAPLVYCSFCNGLWSLGFMVNDWSSFSHSKIIQSHQQSHAVILTRDNFAAPIPTSEDICNVRRHLVLSKGVRSAIGTCGNWPGTLLNVLWCIWEPLHQTKMSVLRRLRNTGYEWLRMKTAGPDDLDSNPTDWPWASFLLCLSILISKLGNKST